MTAVGFIGLGRMGQGMAQNLLRAGYRLVVHDRREEAAAPLVAAGAEWASSAGALAAEVDVVFTSLPGPTEVEQVVLGLGGVAESLRPGLVLFDLSTSSLGLVRRLQQELNSRGADMLDGYARVLEAAVRARRS